MGRMSRKSEAKQTRTEARVCWFPDGGARSRHSSVRGGDPQRSSPALSPSPRRPLIRAAAGAGSTPERRSCLRGEIKGLYRSARRHAFCMRKTLSKRHLGRKKRGGRSGGRVGENMLKRLKQQLCRLERRVFIRLSVKPSSPNRYLRFSSLPFSPSSSSPAHNVEKQEEEGEKKRGTGSRSLSNGGSESVGEFSSSV